MANLVDLSNVNGAIDFKALKKAGISGVWLKATEGATFLDKNFHANRAAANAAGLRVGAYHFARPDNGNTPIAEVSNFASAVGKLGRRDLRPALDLEAKTKMTSADLEAWARAFSRSVEARLGVFPLLYSYSDYLHRLAAHRTIGNGLWLADYGSNNGVRHPVTTPKPWKKIAAHQYTSVGRLPGVHGNVDRNYTSRITKVLAFPFKGLL